MEFGKLQDVSEVDFSLRPEHPDNARVLKNAPGEGPATIYIGCTGWSMKEWVGKVYPAGAKTKDYLHHYSRQFNTIEFNTTHYRVPDLKTVERWYQESAPDFKFCPKIPQSISHRGDLGYGTGMLPDFAGVIQELREKLGPCFLQLPEYFGPEKSKVLGTFLSHFPNHIPLAVELRHPGWFTPEGEEILFPMLEDAGAGAVITDVAGRRDVAHMRLSAAFTMIRFVGNGLHPTDYTRINAWVKRLKQWNEQGIREIYFFPHEPDNLLAPDLSLYLLEKIQEEIPEGRVRGPKLNPPPDLPGLQMDLFA